MKRTYLTLSAVVSLIVLYCLCAHAQERLDDQGALRRVFETEYEAWKRHCDRVSYSSKTRDRLESQHFKKIVAMGPEVLPYVAEKCLHDPNFAWTGWAWLYLSRMNPDPAVNPWAKDAVGMWWQGGKRQVNARFESLYSKLSEVKRQGLPGEVDHIRQSIRALGIAGLPGVVEKLGDGDGDMLQIIKDMMGTEANTSGQTTGEQVKSCLTWWENNSQKWLVPFPNKRPVANAGKDQQVVSGATVLLDGSGSTDEDKDKLTYQWRQTAGPTVELSDAKVVQPSFAAPKVDRETTLFFELVVNDGSPKKEVHPSCQSGQSKPDTVTITVKPTK